MRVLFVFLSKTLTVEFRLRHAITNEKINVQLLRKTLEVEFARGSDPHKIYDSLKKIMASSNLSIQHDADHVFGDALFDHLGKNGISICKEANTYGCTHSLFTHTIAAEGTNVVLQLEKECMVGFNESEDRGCAHSIGHGLGDYMGPQRIRESLEICQRLLWKGLFFGCGEGVFMEYYIAESLVTPPAHLIDPYEPCTKKTKGLYDQLCYLTLPGWWWGDLEMNEKELDALCQGVDKMPLKQYCYMGIGINLAPMLNYNVGILRKICDSMMNQDDRILCRGGAAMAFVDDPRLIAKQKEMCEDLGSNKELCFKKSDISQLLIKRE